MLVFRSLPIRWKLTFWYLSLVALVLILFSGALYTGLRVFLYRSLDNSLENQSALLIESVDVEDGQATIGDRGIRTRPGRQFVRLIDPDRDLLTDSRLDLDTIPVDNPGTRAALDGYVDYRWYSVGDEQLRVRSEPIESDGEVVAVMQVGLSDRGIASMLRRTMFLILSLGVVALGIASVGGVWLARSALRPIDRMTRLATQIGNRDLSQRIDPPPSDDEVGRLARTFNAMLDRLSESIHRQRQFTAAASHELRTPLALLQSQVELALTRERDPESDTQMLEMIGSDVSRLTRIANTLLTLARSDSDEIQLASDQVDVDSLLELVAEQYAPVAEASGVGITVDTEPVDLIGDEDRLIQLVVNLVDNAITHTPEGKSVSLLCRSDDRCAYLTIEDEGVGIEPEHLPYIFERFYRTDESRGRSDGGAGLGLAISQMIVEAHQGSIDVESQPGSGTRMTVSLPLAGPNSMSAQPV